MTRNDEINQLRARLAEAEEELRAWREYDRHDEDTYEVEVRKLHRALKLRTPGVARVAMALYRSPVKRLSHADLELAVPPKDQHRSSGKLFYVLVHWLRQGLGRDGIDTVWGWGWQLTPKGVETIRKALSEKA